jgi:hypothetical protein
VDITIRKYISKQRLFCAAPVSDEGMKHQNEMRNGTFDGNYDLAHCEETLGDFPPVEV